MTKLFEATGPLSAISAHDNGPCVTFRAQGPCESTQQVKTLDREEVMALRDALTAWLSPRVGSTQDIASDTVRGDS